MPRRNSMLPEPNKPAFFFHGVPVYGDEPLPLKNPICIYSTRELLELIQKLEQDLSTVRTRLEQE